MTAPTPKRFDSVALNRVILTGHTPRYDQEALLRLGKDIQKNGLLQPPGLEEVEGGETFTPLWGRHRMLAMLAVGLTHSQAAIYGPLEPLPRVLVGISENAQRQDITLLERFRERMALVTEHGIPQGKVAGLLNESEGTVSMILSIAKATPPVMEAIQSGKLSTLKDIYAICKAPADRQAGLLNVRLQHGADALARAARKPRDEAARLDRVRLVAGELSLTVCGKAMGLAELLAGLEDAAKQVGKAIRQQMDIRTLNAHTRAKAK